MRPLREGGSLWTFLQCLQTMLIVSLSATNLFVKADRDCGVFTWKIEPCAFIRYIGPSASDTSMLLL